MTPPDDGAARRTNRSSAVVRQDLLDAAARLVRERGVAGVTYRDIATAAGASDSVLLRHFGTKNDLIVDAVVTPFTDSLTQLVQTPPRSQESFLAELHACLADNRTVVRTMLAAEVSGNDDPVLAGAGARLREVYVQLAELERGLGAAPDADAYEPDLTARIVLAMMVAVTALDDVLFAGPAGAPPPGDLVRALTALTAHGRAGAA